MTFYSRGGGVMSDLDTAEEVKAMASQDHASDRNIETLIRARVAATRQAAIAEALDMSPSGVNRWVSGQDPVPLSRIGPFLEALGLVVMPRAEHDALRLFAARSLLAGLDVAKGL